MTTCIPSRQSARTVYAVLEDIGDPAMDLSVPLDGREHRRFAKVLGNRIFQVGMAVAIVAGAATCLAVMGGGSATASLDHSIGLSGNTSIGNTSNTSNTSIVSKHTKEVVLKNFTDNRTICKINGFFQASHHIHGEMLFHADAKVHRNQWGVGSLSDKGVHYLWSTGKYAERDWIHPHSRFYSKPFIITNATDIQVLTRGGVGAPNAPRNSFNESMNSTRLGFLGVVLRSTNASKNWLAVRTRKIASWDIEELRFLPWQLRDLVGDEVTLEVIDTYAGNFSWGWLGVRSIAIDGVDCVLPGKTLDVKPTFPKPIDTSEDTLLPCPLAGFYSAEHDLQNFFCKDNWRSHDWLINATNETGTFAIFTHGSHKGKDSKHNHTMIQSKPFWVTLGTTIQVLTRGGTGSGSLDWHEFNPSNSTTQGGFLGVGLMRLRDKMLLAYKSRTKASYDIEELRFGHEDMLPYFGEQVTLTLVDTYHGDMGWLGVHSLSIEGIECKEPTCNLEAEKNATNATCDMDGFYHAANMKHSDAIFEATDEWHRARWGDGSLSGKGQHFLWSPGQYQVRDKQHLQARIRSKPFVLTPLTDLKVLTRGGTGNRDAHATFDRSKMTSSDHGFLGVVIRKVSNGKWILNKTRAAANWHLEDLHFRPSDFKGYMGQEVTLDIVDTYHGDYEWGWIGIRAISMHGTGCHHVGDLYQELPEPDPVMELCPANFFYNAEWPHRLHYDFCPNGGLDDFRRHVQEDSNWTHKEWTFNATSSDGDFHLVSVNNYSDRNGPHNQAMYRTRPFYITNTTDISILCRGGRGGAPNITAFDARNLSRPDGFMGAAIRTYDDNRTFVLSKRRPKTPGSSWELGELRFSPEDLKPWLHKKVELDIIDAYHSEDGELGWLGIHTIKISGANCSVKETMEQACNETLFQSAVPQEKENTAAVATATLFTFLAGFFASTCCNPMNCVNPMDIINSGTSTAHSAASAGQHLGKIKVGDVAQVDVLPERSTCCEDRVCFKQANVDALVHAINMAMPKSAVVKGNGPQEPAMWERQVAEKVINTSLEKAQAVIDFQKKFNVGTQFFWGVAIVVAIFVPSIRKFVQGHVLSLVTTGLMGILSKFGLDQYIQNCVAHVQNVNVFSMIENVMEQGVDHLMTQVETMTELAQEHGQEIAASLAQSAAQDGAREQAAQLQQSVLYTVLENILKLLDEGGRLEFKHTFHLEMLKAGVKGIQVEWRELNDQVKNHLKVVGKADECRGVEGFGACVQYFASDPKMQVLRRWFKNTGKFEKNTGAQEVASGAQEVGLSEKPSGKFDTEEAAAAAAANVKLFEDEEDKVDNEDSEVTVLCCKCNFSECSLPKWVGFCPEPKEKAVKGTIGGKAKGVEGILELNEHGACIVNYEYHESPVEVGIFPCTAAKEDWSHLIIHKSCISDHEKTYIGMNNDSVRVELVLSASGRGKMKVGSGDDKDVKFYLGQNDETDKKEGDKEEGDKKKKDNIIIYQVEAKLASEVQASSWCKAAPVPLMTTYEGRIDAKGSINIAKVSRNGKEETVDFKLDLKKVEEADQKHRIAISPSMARTMRMSFVMYTVDADVYKLSRGWKEPVVEVVIEEPEPIVVSPPPAPQRPMPPMMMLPPSDPNCMGTCSGRFQESCVTNCKWGVCNTVCTCCRPGI